MLAMSTKTTSTDIRYEYMHIDMTDIFHIYSLIGFTFLLLLSEYSLHWMILFLI